MKARQFYPLVLAGISILACSSAAHADDLGDWVKFDGFGTIGAFKGNNANAGVRVDSRQSTASQNEWRFDGDTQASLQATFNPQGKLKAVLQLISKKDIKSSTKPTVEWAYVSYPIASDFDFKLGRTVAPVFLMSDYRNLAYAQTTVRPQSEVYNINAITYQDGMTGRWDKKVGSGNLQIEGFFGKTTVSNAVGEVKLDRVKGFSVKYADGSWAVRTGYSKYNAAFNAPTVAATIKGLTALPAAVCTNCSTVVPAVANINDMTAAITTVGASYDDGEWIAQAEWAKRTGNSVIIAAVSGWNVLGAYRYGDFTPYIGAGKYTTDAANPGLQAGPFAPAALKVQLNYLNASFIGVGRADHDTLTLGTRWDFAKNVALKLQYEKIKMAYPSVGASSYVSYPTGLLGKPNGFDGRVSLVTVNLDFVF